MSTNAPPDLETSGTDDSTDTLDDRETRALTEYMTVLDDVDEARDAPDLYRVVGQHGGTYTVDTRGHGRCTCPDAKYRLDADEHCKHQHRVAFATGVRAIPAWVDHDTVDPDLGAHVDGEPRVAATDGGTDVIEAGDEGIVLEEERDDQEGDDTDGRPEDCDCAPFLADAGLPCWPCYRDGFREPNPDATEETDD